MKPLRVIAAAVVLTAALALTACAPTPVVAPVTVSANDLQGETVKVALNQVLNINTGDLAVDSYTAEIDDPAIVEFVQGRTDGSAEFNPGFTPLKVGSTDVTMTNEQGGIQPLQFTIEVTPVPAGSNLGGTGR
ncbi:MAG: hypothetical protein WA006_02170 [Rhodoglobus sp.]